LSRFRLQILVNGRAICTAGIGESGSLNACVHYSYTPPEDVARWARPPTKKDDEGGAQESCVLDIQGLD
jgi:hypothetical protein